MSRLIGPITISVQGKNILVAINLFLGKLPSGIFYSVASNLPAVAQKMVQTSPGDTPVVIAADNDASQTGITKAQEAAAVFGDRARVTMPVLPLSSRLSTNRLMGP